MFVAKTISSGHNDLIHDVSFDYHGRRMATCSSDQTVKVWDVDEEGAWQCTASWRTHTGSVWRVTWAHPEFGQVLATCSFDRTAAVWEELSSDATAKGANSTNTWIKRTSLVDSRTSVTDVRFAPKHLGLQLATCSADGIVRIYEAVDIMNLSNWQLHFEFNCNVSLSCLSWNTSRMHAPMIAVGSDDPSQSAGGKVHIYEYSDTARKWLKVETLHLITEPVHDVRFAPNLGRSYHLLAIAARDLTIVSMKISGKESGSNPGGVSKPELRLVGSFDDHESVVWRVSWNITGTILASSGDDGCVRLWKANYLDNWKCLSVLKADSNASEAERASMHQASISTTPTSNSISFKIGSFTPLLRRSVSQM
ncbi:nucleoporin SEH1 isoform X2 [Aplysia californica]|uniref:Nucleoporin SEH1 isoform X2 n=1 Tax=Aplysia californica TaxID=6500 RepID=A0ABM0ZUS6_APLCA|nr:nucleoporin SEH1 isoform X2 [Aplysia californica]